MRAEDFQTIGVLIAGDDGLARAGLSTLLGREEELVVLGESAIDARTLLDAVHTRDPDVIVLDAGSEAIELPRDLDVPVLALVDDAAAALDALGDTVHGVIARDSVPHRVAAALAAVVRRTLVVDDAFAGPFISRRSVAGAPVALTPREAEVLELLAEGLSNREVAAELSISEHTAKFHVNALLDKLDATTRTEAVVRAIRLGVLDL